MTSPDSRNANVVISASPQGYIQGTQQATDSTNRLIDAVDKLSSRLNNLTRSAGKKLVHFSAADFAALGAATADAALFQKQMSTLAATSKITSQSMSGFKRSVEDAFTRFPVSRTEVVQLTTALDNMGITGTKSIHDLTQTFIRLGGATGESTTAMAMGLTQLSRLMGTTSATQITNYANALLTVSKNAGTSATDVLNFAQAIAPMARQAGIGQAAVIGISNAFSKAGADGYVAANTFNSMVSEITNLINTGSPELSKYANLIGMTVEQFKRMDKTSALVDIFNTLAQQGPKAINTLNQLGYSGVRAQSAIAAVVQSGNLQQSIAQAMGASGNSNNLNKASNAAFGGLSDRLTEVRNQFTQLGTEIGTTFLAPMTAAVGAVNRLMQGMNNLIRPFSAVIAAAAGVGGAVAGVGGIALHFAGLIGTVALGKTLLNSGPRGAFREGRSAGMSARLGVRSLPGVYEQALNEGDLPLRNRLAFRVGETSSRFFGNPLAEEQNRNRLRQGLLTLRYPMRTMSWLADDNSRTLKNAFVHPLDRISNTRDETGMGALGRSMKQIWSENYAASSSVTKSFRALAGETARLGKAMAGAVATTAGAGTRLIGGRVGGLVASGASMATGALFSFPGMIATAVGTMAWQKFKEAQSASRVTAEDLNPLAALNDKLGVANTALASFGDHITAVTQKLNPDDWATARNLSGTDVSAAAGQKYQLSMFQQLAKHGGNQNVAAALLNTLPITDANTLQAIKSDLVNSVGQTGAQFALNQQGGQADLATLGAYAGSTQGSGFFQANPSKTAKGVTGTVYNYIQGQAQQASTNFGQKFADLQKLQQFSTYASAQIQNASDPSKAFRQLQSSASSLFGTKLNQQAYYAAINAGQSPQQAIVSSLNPSTLPYFGGQAPTFFQNLGGTSTDMSQYGTTALALRAPTLNSLYGKLGAQGGLGSYVTQATGDVANALANPGSQSAQYNAVQGMFQAASFGAKSFNDVATAAQKMKDAIVNTQDPLYQLAEAVKQQAMYRQSVQMPTFSRAGQLATLYSNVQGATAESGDLRGQDIQAAQQAFDAQKEQQREYEISLLQTIRGANQQIEYAQHDHDLQMARAQEDFQTQSLRSTAEFNKQQTRAQQDFNTQMQRAAQSSAESIYNPFERVQATYTNSASSVLANLQDQNARIGRQYANLQKAQKAGLSQNAIDTLQLGSSQNAQQLQALVDTMTPALVKQINAAVGTRQSSTKTLTQSDYQEQFRYEVADFSKSVKRSTADFATSMGYSVADFKKSMSRSETDFTTSIDRQRKDLVQSLQEITGDYDTIHKEVLAQAGKLNKELPHAADGIVKALNDAAAIIGLYDNSQKQKSMSADTISSISLLPGASLAGVPAGPYATGSRAAAPSGYAAKPKVGQAYGGIATRPYVMGEGFGPELNIPLNNTAHKFMAQMYSQISRELAAQMRVAGRGLTASYTSPIQVTQVDSSFNVNGPVTVQSETADQFMKEMKAKERYSKLTRPTGRGQAR